ncbi:MAG: hypothetical protein K6T61_12845 [Bryobacteraceae bacterium]|nr:hypothetical protein [Bryobacteraceae bacterium]
MEIHSLAAVGAEDRRHEVRHAVKRPCRIYPASLPGAELAGWTGNASRSGLYVRMDVNQECRWRPSAGEALRVLIELPAAPDRVPRFLACTGGIVRSGAAPEGGTFVALELHEMKFVKAAPDGRRERPALSVQ